MKINMASRGQQEMDALKLSGPLASGSGLNRFSRMHGDKGVVTAFVVEIFSIKDC
jgi:hypothetical protein